MIRARALEEIDLETVVAAANNVIDPEVKLHCLTLRHLSSVCEKKAPPTPRSDKEPDGKQISPKSFKM